MSSSGLLQGNDDDDNKNISINIYFTDVIVFAEYCKDGHLYWALGTLIFIVTPNILINIFSMRWIVTDQKSSFRHWATHICLVGLLERYSNVR